MKRWTVHYNVVLIIFLFAPVLCAQRPPVYKPGQYAAPRYPRFVAKATPESLLKAARFVVRQTAGMDPLGRMKSGQNVYVLLQWGQDMNVWNAIKTAWAERGVKAHALWVWQVMGISKQEYDKRLQGSIIYGNQGWKEAGIFLLADYRKYYPPDIQKQFGHPIVDFQVIKTYLNGYLDKHPEIQHLYAGNGGPTFLLKFLTPQHRKIFEGNYIYFHPVDLLSKAAEFPSDVWNLVQEKIVRAIPFVSEVDFQDPEGTHLHFLVTRKQAEHWSHNNGISIGNHIYIYPDPTHATLEPGAVLVAHANHTGEYPTMTVHVDQHGLVQNIEGGGKLGDLFRMIVNNPLFKDAKIPTAPEPGYWFIRQDGYATNPKFVRSFPELVQGDTFLPNVVERQRAGVQHLAFGYNSEDPKDVAYAKKRGIPLGWGQHNFHMHQYFPTVKWKLRDTGEWITIGDKGFVKMFDDPEVQALASRYGDPKTIFRYDWIPEIPGINVPGNYWKDFAQDPWGYMMKEWKQIQDGTYKYFVEDYSMFKPAALK